MAKKQLKIDFFAYGTLLNYSKEFIENLRRLLDKMLKNINKMKRENNQFDFFNVTEEVFDNRALWAAIGESILDVQPGLRRGDIRAREELMYNFYKKKILRKRD